MSRKCDLEQLAGVSLSTSLSRKTSLEGGEEGVSNRVATK